VRPSLWSLGFIMIVLGVGSLAMGHYYGVQPTATSGVVAAALAIGGASLFVPGKPAVFWIALSATVITIAFAAASFLLKRPVGLPLPPIISLVAGLYLCFRLVLSRGALRPRPTVADED
jgi:hypothetical protein